MVNELQSNSMICWSDAGDTFIVQRQQEFAKQVLPRFFKHGNFSSFVRQLNMYGFHKVPHLQQGAMEGCLDRLEFSNPHFKRDQPDLLLLVSRKKGSRDTENGENRSPTSTDLQHLLDEMAAIKKHQMMVSTDLKQIQNDNQLLWQETLAARERYQQQQDTIDKILHFLASVFSEKTNNGISRKRPFLLSNADNEEEVRTVSPLKLARTDKSGKINSIQLIIGWVLLIHFIMHNDRSIKSHVGFINVTYYTPSAEIKKSGRGGGKRRERKHGY
ncbi:hypothetical protein K492DRAFT_61331 [Lichtheimia hyalospora FSU 10163]|nr:hypothetical protein K492DRAFT_61331 [Lichtheimia hyalospora FSU 10163]